LRQSFAGRPFKQSSTRDNPVQVIVSNTQIKRLPPVQTGLGSNSGLYDLFFSNDLEHPFWNATTFCVPQFGAQYAVVASGIVVATAEVVANQSEAALSELNEVAVEAALAEVRTVVGAIRECRPLKISHDLGDLMTRAVQAQGAPDDIEKWARLLAGDVGNLTD
jgi:hypothetical protein